MLIIDIWSTTRTDGPGRHAKPRAGRLRWRHRRRWSTGAPCRSSSLPVWAKRNQTLTVSARSALALAQVRWIGRELNTFRRLASSSYLLRRRHHYGWHRSLHHRRPHRGDAMSWIISHAISAVKSETPHESFRAGPELGAVAARHLPHAVVFRRTFRHGGLLLGRVVRATTGRVCCRYG